MKSIGIGVLCGIFFITLNGLYKRTNHYQNRFDDIWKFDKLQDHLNFVNTGSTFANYAFDYTDLGLRGFNFAINGQNLEYDYKMLKNYASKIEKGATVFIACADMEMLYTTNKYYYSNVRIYKYYRGILPLSEIPFFPIHYIVGILLPLLRHPFATKYILRGNDVDRYNKFEKEENLLSADELIKDATKRVQGWIHVFHIYNWELNTEHWAAIEKNKRILSAILEFCKENSWYPVVVIPPVSEVLNTQMNFDFLDKCLYQPITEVCERQGVQFVDFATKVELQGTENYINSACLNKVGRKKFIKLLFDHIGLKK